MTSHKVSGDPAEPIVPKVAFPEIQWVSIAAGTRQADDNLEDRATAYVNSTQNILLVNEDFRMFTDLMEHFMRLYEGYAGAEQTHPPRSSRSVVQPAAGRGRARRPGRPREREGAAERGRKRSVGGGAHGGRDARYNLYQQVSRVLGSKLGSIKSKLEAA